VKFAEYEANTREARIQDLLANLKGRDQSRVLEDEINYLDGRTSIRKLQVALKIPYVCDYKEKLCRKDIEVIKSHLNPNVLVTGQGEAMRRKEGRLKLGDLQASNGSSD
jgi:hypothetical protein